MNNTNEPTHDRTSAPGRSRWFAHHKLDAYHVALEAMVLGMAIAKSLPRGYAKLKDQLERALQGMFTQTTEAAARTGADRRARFRAARAETCEAAGIVEGLGRLRVVDASQADELLDLLWREAAMLTRLAGLPR